MTSSLPRTRSTTELQQRFRPPAARSCFSAIRTHVQPAEKRTEHFMAHSTLVKEFSLAFHVNSHKILFG